MRNLTTDALTYVFSKFLLLVLELQALVLGAVFLDCRSKLALIQRCGRSDSGGSSDERVAT